MTGCDEPPEEPAGIAVRDSAGVQVITASINSSAPQCVVSEDRARIGSSDEAAASQLFRVRGATWLSEGRLAVLNAGTSQVKVFSEDGELLHQFGRAGQGPGELQNPWMIASLGEDTVVVGQLRPLKFSFFTERGDFLRSVVRTPRTPQRPDVVIPLPDGQGFWIGMACCIPDWGSEEFVDQSIDILHHTPSGVVADTIETFWFGQVGWLDERLRLLDGPLFAAQADFARLSADQFVYAPGRYSQVEIWNASGELERIIRWGGPSRKVDPEEVSEWRHERRERFTPGNERDRQFIEAIAGESRPVADSFPSRAKWNGLEAADGRYVWVQEFRRPSHVGQNRWLVLDSESGRHCVARIPEGLTVLDIEDGRVIALERDEFDVEHIVVREVFPPGTNDVW